jgi:hypothetical protein
MMNPFLDLEDHSHAEFHHPQSVKTSTFCKSLSLIAMGSQPAAFWMAWVAQGNSSNLIVGSAITRTVL